MENTLICANTIEKMKFELYTNNNKKCYQTLKISTDGTMIETNKIAQVDFFTISSAIMCSNDLNTFIESVQHTWCKELLENMIEEVFDTTEGYI